MKRCKHCNWYIGHRTSCKTYIDCPHLLAGHRDKGYYIYQCLKCNSVFCFPNYHFVEKWLKGEAQRYEFI